MTWVAFAHGYAIADMVSTIATSLSLVSVAAPRQQSVSVLRRRSFIEPVMVTWRSMVAAIAISSPARAATRSTPAVRRWASSTSLAPSRAVDPHRTRNRSAFNQQRLTVPTMTCGLHDRHPLQIVPAGFIDARSLPPTIRIQPILRYRAAR